MNIPEQDRKYDIMLLLLGGIIGYVSTFYGGFLLLLVIGATLATVIGVKSASIKNALLLGAFFGVVIVTSSSELVQGHGSDWSQDILSSIFLPYFRDAIVAAALSGIVSLSAHMIVHGKTARR